MPPDTQPIPDQALDRAISMAQAVTHFLKVGTFIREAKGDEDVRYGRALRAPIRGYWKTAQDPTVGVTVQQLFEMLFSAIERHLTRAFNTGAQEMGVTPDEFTATEIAARASIIRNEQSRLDAMVDRVVVAVDEGKNLTQTYAAAKLSLWLSRFEDTKSRARALVGADQKLKWVIDFAKEHCGSCIKLQGKVKRASQWLQAQVRPRSPPNDKLE